MTQWECDHNLANVSRRQALKLAGAGAVSTTIAPGTASANAATGPTIYFGSIDGVYAVDAATGQQNWAFTDPGDVVFSSPTVVNGTVFAGCDDGSIYAVDAATGQQEWAFTEPSKRVFASPTVVDGTVYIGGFDGTLYAVDAATGQHEWAFTEPAARLLAAPAVVDGIVYVGAEDNTLYAVNAATGQREWAFTAPTNSVNSSPTVFEGTVFFGTNDPALYAVDAITGQEEWLFSAPSESVRSSPTIVDGTVFVGADDGILYAIDVATGQEKWTFTEPTNTVVPDRGISSSPTVVDGTVYVGSRDSSLYSVDAATGQQEWAFTEPTSPVTSSPTVFEDTVFIGAQDDTLYAVDVTTGRQEWTASNYSGFASSSPTAVEEPENGDSVGSRVTLGTLGHHHTWASEASGGTGGGEQEEIDATIIEFETHESRVTPGERVTSTVTVENTGDVEHTFFVGYSIVDPDGEEYHNNGETGKPVELKPEEKTTVTLKWRVEDTAPENTPLNTLTIIWEESSSNELETEIDRAWNNNVIEIVTQDNLDSVEIGSFLTIPPTPQPGEEIVFEAMIRAETSTEEQFVAELLVNEEKIETTNINGIDDTTLNLQWEPAFFPSPGNYTAKLVLTERDRSTSKILEDSFSFDVPPVALQKMNTGMPSVEYTESDGGIYPAGVRTVVELKNPRKEVVELDLEFNVDNDQIAQVESLEIEPSSTIRRLFWWNSEPGNYHTTTITITTEGGYEFEASSTFVDDSAIVLPTKLAYGEGRPEFDGRPIHFAPALRSIDIFDNRDNDNRTLLVPFPGEGKLNVTVKDMNQNVIGEAYRESDKPEFVEVGINPSDGTTHIIVEISENSPLKSAMLSTPHIGTPFSQMENFLQISHAVSEYSFERSVPDRQPDSLLFRFVYIVELSGYPVSDDLIEYTNNIGRRHAWQTLGEAIAEITLAASDWIDTTNYRTSSYVTSDHSSVDSTESMGVALELSEDVDFGNKEGIGKIDIYEYNDVPSIVTKSSSSTNQSEMRYIDIKTTDIIDGTARTSIFYNTDDETESFDQDRLNLAYWDEDNWESAENISLNESNQYIVGDLPADKLTGTPILVEKETNNGKIPEWVPIVGGAAGLTAAGYGISKLFGKKNPSDEN